MGMSSAERRLLIYSPSIFKPLTSQISRRNMFSRAAVNSLGDMICPSVTPLLMLILLLSFLFVDRVAFLFDVDIFISPVLEARSVLFEFALSRRLSRMRRMHWRVSVGLRR